MISAKMTQNPCKILQILQVFWARGAEPCLFTKNHPDLANFTKFLRESLKLGEFQEISAFLRKVPKIYLKWSSNY